MMGGRSSDVVDEAVLRVHAVGMSTTPILVDTETYEKLVEMSGRLGLPLAKTLAVATETLRRHQFAERVARELEEHRSDDEAWASLIADANEAAL